MSIKNSFYAFFIKKFHAIIFVFCLITAKPEEPKFAHEVCRATQPASRVSYPNGKAKGLKLASDSFLNFNKNRTRLTYRTNTEPGSSGSPCFDANLELVALHHSGDPGKYKTAEYNEGIPMDAICRDLENQGLGNLFAEKWLPDTSD